MRENIWYQYDEFFETWWRIPRSRNEFEHGPIMFISITFTKQACYLPVHQMTHSESNDKRANLVVTISFFFSESGGGSFFCFLERYITMGIQRFFIKEMAGVLYNWITRRCWLRYKNYKIEEWSVFDLYCNCSLLIIEVTNMKPQKREMCFVFWGSFASEKEGGFRELVLF